MKYFFDVQEILFENDCFWLSDKISQSQEYKHFYLDYVKCLKIKNNIITIIESSEIYNYDYEYFDTFNIFLRIYKMKKVCI